MTIFKTTFYRMFCSILSNLVLISLPSPRGDSCAAEHNGEKGGLVLRLVSFTAVSPSLGSLLGELKATCGELSMGVSDDLETITPLSLSYLTCGFYVHQHGLVLLW